MLDLWAEVDQLDQQVCSLVNKCSRVEVGTDWAEAVDRKLLEVDILLQVEVDILLQVEVDNKLGLLGKELQELPVLEE